MLELGRTDCLSTTIPKLRNLVVPIDHILLNECRISNWRTRYGDLDVLADIPGHGGIDGVASTISFQTPNR